MGLKPMNKPIFAKWENLPIINLCQTIYIHRGKMKNSRNHPTYEYCILFLTENKKIYWEFGQYEKEFEKACKYIDEITS